MFRNRPRAQMRAFETNSGGSAVRQGISQGFNAGAFAGSFAGQVVLRGLLLGSP